MAGEILKRYEMQIGVRDPGKSDLSGFNRAAGMLQKSAHHLEAIGNTAYGIAKENREIEAMADINQYEFSRDESGDIVAPALPEAGPLGYTIYEQKYREGLALRYRNEMLAESEQTAAEIRARNLNNPAGFQEEWGEYIAERSQDIPEDIRGMTLDKMESVGQGQYKSLVLNKGVADFAAGKESQEAVINKSLRDIVMAVNSGGDIQTPEGSELLMRHWANLLEYQNTFLMGDDEVKARWLVDAAESLQRKVITSGFETQILTDALGNNRNLGAAEYDATLESLTAIRDGSAKMMVPIFDEESQSFTFAEMSLDTQLDQDERDALAEKMEKVAKTSHQLYRSGLVATEKNIRAEFAALQFNMIRDGNLNLEEAAIASADRLQAKYASDTRPEISAMINGFAADIIKTGRSEKSYRANKLYHKIYSRLYEESQDQLGALLGFESDDLNEIRMQSPELYNRLMDKSASIQSALNNASRSSGAKNDFQLGMAQYQRALSQSDGDHNAAMAHMIKQADFTTVEGGGSQKMRMESNQTFFGSFTPEELGAMSPTMLAKAAAPSIAMGVIPASMVEEIENLRNIDNPAALNDVQAARAIAMYDAITAQHGGAYALQETFKKKNPGIQMLSNMGPTAGFTPSIRNRAKDMIVNPDLFGSAGNYKTMNPETRDLHIKFVRDNLVDPSWMPFSREYTVPPQMMVEMTQAYFAALPTSTGDPAEGSEEAFNRALSAVTTGNHAWRHNDAFLPLENADYVRDPVLNYAAGGKVDRSGFFASDQANRFIESQIGAPDGSVELGENAVIRWAGVASDSKPNHVFLFKLVENVGGVEEPQYWRDQNGDVAIIDLTPGIDAWHRGQAESGPDDGLTEADVYFGRRTQLQQMEEQKRAEAENEQKKREEADRKNRAREADRKRATRLQRGIDNALEEMRAKEAGQ